MRKRLGEDGGGLVVPGGDVHPHHARAVEQLVQVLRIRALDAVAEIRRTSTAAVCHDRGPDQPFR
jgi:hypothetical protein